MLAMLVLLSGLVGFYVLNKSSLSTDTVAKEKAPVQYAVMKVILAIEKVQKLVMQYTSTTTGLQTLANDLSASLDEFDILKTTFQEQDNLRRAVTALIESHNKYARYSIPVGQKNIPCLISLNRAQISHLDWLRFLKDAVNIETTVTGITDPHKDLLGDGSHPTTRLTTPNSSNVSASYANSIQNSLKYMLKKNYGHLSR